jgi:CcmD family protein
VSQGQYVAAVYGVVFVVVLAYVAIIAAKLARLERQTAELLQLAAERRPSASPEVPSGDPATSRIS